MRTDRRDSHNSGYVRLADGFSANSLSARTGSRSFGYGGHRSRSSISGGHLAGSVGIYFGERNEHHDYGSYLGYGYGGYYGDYYGDQGYFYPPRYASYRPAYWSYYGSYGYDPYGYSTYGYYPYRRSFSIFDFSYRQSAAPVYIDNVVYTQAPTADYSSVPASTGTTSYYVAPSQPPAASAPEVIDEASSVQPDEESSYWVEQGVKALAAERYEEARGYFMRAVLADDTDGFAKVFYGLANFSVGDYGAAALAFRRGLRAAPELIDNPIDLRSLYADEDELEVHVNRLAGLLAEHPGDGEARFLLAYIYYATAKPDMAAATLLPLMDRDGEDTLAELVRDAALRMARRPT